jgi:hypothetical protein
MAPLYYYDISVPGDLKFERLCLSLKGKSIKNTYLGKLPYTISRTFTQRICWLSKNDSGVIDTAAAKSGDLKVFTISKPFSKSFKFCSGSISYGKLAILLKLSCAQKIKKKQ